MVFVLNAWYVAAWTQEVDDQPIRRMICSQPMALFRDRHGKIGALADRCAHRAYPLSEGVVVGDLIQCGYHGFSYDTGGICKLIPAQDKVPSRLAVRSYPVVEKDGWIWVWPGDAALAEPGDVPDTHWMKDPGWATVTHSVGFDCRAQLIHDNLLDLTHETFLHTSTVGDDYIPRYPLTVTQDGNVVTADRFMPGVVAPPLYAATMGTTGLVDRFHCTQFFVPSYHLLHSGITAQGRPREEGYLIKVLNAITPIDTHTSWYFYAFCRNFAVADQQATADLQSGLGIVLQEDADALARQEVGMQGRHCDEHDILISQDTGLVKARHLTDRMVAAETLAAGRS